MSQWKILIIDDNPEDRAVYRRHLQHDPNVQYIIKEADLGSAGLALCQTFEPACILLDYRLPDLDGLEVLAQLQSDMTLPTRPAVVMLTGTGNEALAAEAIKNGAHDYLRKDELSAESLRLAVANSIEKAALRRMLDAQRRELEHLHTAVQQTSESIMITDAHLEPPGPRITFVNPAFTTMTGYTAEEVLGKTPRLLQGPKTDRTVLDRLARDLTEGRVFHGETVNYRKDGSAFVLEWRIAPLRDAEGRVTHFVATQHDITERKQAEVALREREQELADFFDTATVGLHWVGPDGIILRVNQAELDLLGYTREEYVGHHIAEFHDDPAVIQDILRRLTNGERLHDYPAQLRRKDGTVRDVLINSSVLWKDGRFLHTRCFTRDITASKQDEIALRDSEAKFAAAFQTNPQPMALMTSDGRYVEVNTALEHSMGYTREEMLGHTTAELGFHTDPQRRETFYHLLQQDGHVRDFEVVWVTRTRERRILLISAEPLTLKGERYLLAVNNDITERKVAEERLRTNEQFLTSLLAAAPLVIYLFDVSTRQNVYVSASATSTLGYDTIDALNVGTPEFMARVMHPEDQAGLAVHFAQLERTCAGEVLDYEYRMQHRNGDWRWFHSRDTVFSRMADNQIQQILGVAVDITARKEGEREREQLLIELQRANEEFQQFSYVVAHDLNEPLRTISNFVTMLAQRYEGALDAEAHEYITFATDGAQRLQQMIRDLLAYTRVGRTPEFEAVDCEELLARVVESVQLQIAECGAVITHDPLPTVHGDRTRLSQVFQNLIGNALKFRGTAPPRIHVSAVQEDAHWRFVVRDNGIGIDPTQVGRLFQVFQRLHTRSEYPGTGIGLAICKKIVEQHGGRIWVESRPGEGAIFSFTVSDTKEK